MSNDHQDNSNTRDLPFSHGFNFGTTIQNVFRNINQTFSNSHDPSSAQQRDINSQDDIPPLEPLNAVVDSHNTRPTDTTLSSGPTASIPSIPPVSPPADIDMPSHHSQTDSQLDDDEDSMPELQSATDSSDESEVSASILDPVPAPSHQDLQPGGDGRDSVGLTDEGGPPPERITGTRRARVDDDGDDARDRRHPSERVGGPPPPRDTVPQNAGPQQLPRHQPGLFVPFFGLGAAGGNAPPERVHAGEDAADLSSVGNNPTPGHAPRGVPVLTAGFTLTIPLFGPQQGNSNGAGVATGTEGGAPGAIGMDAAAREELLAAFAAFFQEFQGSDEAWEDPERAKKLIAGLEVVPLGLVKRLERVGGAPGGHIGDSTTEGASGCAICWDTLLDAEGDSFSGQQVAGAEVPHSSSPVVEGRSETRIERDTMDVDAPSVSTSHSEPSTSTSTLPPSEPPKIISLPCAHVFHASCLLPWFTRAKQATCPTCRFNVDPENITYTPRPRRPFNRTGPTRPDGAVPNPAPADPQAAPQVPSEAPRAADATAPPVNPAHTDADADADGRPAAAPSDTETFPPTGQAGVPPPGLGFNPFVFIPGIGIPILSFPAIQVPLRQTAMQAPDNQGVDVLTIGFDMFVGGLPPQERDGDRRDDAEAVDGANNGEAGAGTGGGNGATNPNGLGLDFHSLIEGLLRTTRNIVPQVINGQGPVPPPAPAPAPDAPPADGARPQPYGRPTPEAAGPHPAPLPTGGPRVIPAFPSLPGMFRATRPMPPRRDPKTWAVPPAPGLSLRQRVEQREREQGLRCSDTSCGVGPSDDDPYPDPYASLTKQASIRPLPDRNNPESDGRGSVCSHAFHPACLVSAERVAGWGGEDKMEPLVEVSCPVCRAVGCVTRDVWESGVSEL